jgi:CubicO group peptidase (beta-lactamase class C family)
MSDLEHQLRTFLAERESEGEIPTGAGVACAVVRKGDVLYQGAFGLRDREAQLPVTLRTRFDMASNTKAFTATALLVASQEGALDLDAPLAKRTAISLSDPAASAELSALDILSHRSGLPAHDLLWYLAAPKDLTARLRHLPLVPGAYRRTFIYNNLMVGALGRELDRLVGTSWGRLVQTRVLDPLGMSRARLEPPQADEPDCALPYVGDKPVPRVDLRAIAAAGALRADVEDMARWLAFQLGAGPRLLSADSLSRQRVEHASTDVPNPLLLLGFEWLASRLAYGLGWFLGSTRGKTALFHPGFIDGFSTAVVLVPELEIGAVVLSNVHCSRVPGRIAERLIACALGEEAPRLASPPPAPPPAAPPESVRVARPRAEGRFEDAAYGTIELREGGSGAVLEYAGHAWPLAFASAESASFVPTVSGFQMPLPVAVNIERDRIERIAIPFSLDPRVPPQTFSRV